MLQKLKDALTKALSFLAGNTQADGTGIVAEVEGAVTHVEKIVETIDADLKAALARIAALEAIVKPPSTT